MKLKNTVGIYFFLIFTIWGCNKQGLTKETKIEPKATSEKIKTWLNAQSGSVNSQRVLLDGKVIDIPETVLWNQTNYFEEVKTNITPVGSELENGNLTKNRYLVTKFDENGKVNRGNYYEVLNSKNTTNATESISITPDFLNLKNIPNGFTGAIIKYDNDNNIIFSRHYDDGVLTDKTDKVSVRKSKNQTPIDNIAPLDEGCDYVTIDWYWQTYENGVLISEEYLYSTQSIVCEGGSGGGGGTATCAVQNENFANQGAATSGPITTMDEYNNGTIWIRNYNWSIFTAGSWGLLSYEKGTLEKIIYPSTQRWEFTNFIHVRIAEVGLNVGGTRTFVDVDNTINITPTRTSAWVRIDFTVSSKATCWPGNPLIQPFNANKTFAAPNSVVAVAN